MYLKQLKSINGPITEFWCCFRIIISEKHHNYESKRVTYAKEKASEPPRYTKIGYRAEINSRKILKDAIIRFSE